MSALTGLSWVERASERDEMYTLHYFERRERPCYFQEQEKRGGKKDGADVSKGDFRGNVCYHRTTRVRGCIGAEQNV